jgi:hypothetical protein
MGTRHVVSLKRIHLGFSTVWVLVLLTCRVPLASGPDTVGAEEDSDMSLVHGHGWRNGPTNCRGDVKYRKDGMGLAAETYYP